MIDLVKKYDIRGPRYTSYPPVPFWTGAPSFIDWIVDLKKSYQPGRGIDLYIHIPFCDSICHYCGCNRIKCNDQDMIEKYVDTILSEWQLYTSHLGHLSINSIHFGGGTPTLLSPKLFIKIFSTLRKYYREDFVGSIELNPRLTTPQHLKIFKEWGIQRISIGVQDLNDQVLASINRSLTKKEIVDFYNQARSCNFESINFDLIYGLPYQTQETIKETFTLVNDLAPDVLAYYGYAHVPWKADNQKSIEEGALPDPKTKSELFEIGSKELLSCGYIPIGLDHFGKRDSFLARALSTKSLQRNFMGYTDRKSNITLGLGVSSISSTPCSFVQNPKTTEEYESFLISENRHFIAGHSLSAEETIVQKTIAEIMCNGECDLDPLLTIPQKQLLEMERDGILKLDGRKLSVTNLGMPFVRNISMLFDPALKKNEKCSTLQFSRTI